MLAYTWSMSGLDLWIVISFGIVLFWILGVLTIALWLTKRVIPSLLREMEQNGVTEAQRRVIMTKTMFPPRFRR